MPNSGYETFLIVVLIIVVAAMVAQLFVMLLLFFGFAKMAKNLKEEIGDIRSAVMPIIFDLRKVLTKASPQLESAVVDLAVFTHSLRNQTEELEATSTEVSERVRRLSSRLDSMLSNMLDIVERSGNTLNDAVARPLRQVAGIVASAKAIIESLREKTAPLPHVTRSRGDNRDLFV
jgi:methyl-accepting chemotaxis protein